MGIHKKFNCNHVQRQLIRAYARALQYKCMYGYANLEEYDARWLWQDLVDCERELDALITAADAADSDEYNDEISALADKRSDLERKLSKVVAKLCESEELQFLP